MSGIPGSRLSLHALTRQKDSLPDRLAAEAHGARHSRPLALSISQLSDRPTRVSAAFILAATGASRKIVKATLSRLVSEGLLVGPR